MVRLFSICGTGAFALVMLRCGVPAHAAKFFGLGATPGAVTRSATGVSDNGSIVVGASNAGEDEVGLPANEAFRWTNSEGMVRLGHLPGSGESVARGVSAVGSIVVGSGPSISGVEEAFRWTSGSGMVGLGDLL